MARLWPSCAPALRGVPSEIRCCNQRFGRNPDGVVDFSRACLLDKGPLRLTRTNLRTREGILKTSCSRPGHTLWLGHHSPPEDHRGHWTLATKPHHQGIKQSLTAALTRASPRHRLPRSGSAIATTELRSQSDQSSLKTSSSLSTRNGCSCGPASAGPVAVRLSAQIPTDC
jgi:hypothetical protein